MNYKLVEEGSDRKRFDVMQTIILKNNKYSNIHNMHNTYVVNG